MISVPVKAALKPSEFVVILDMEQHMKTKQHCMKIPSGAAVLRWVRKYEKVDAPSKAEMLVAKGARWPTFLVYAMAEVQARQKALRRIQLEESKILRRRTQVDTAIEKVRQSLRQNAAAYSGMAEQ